VVDDDDRADDVEDESVEDYRAQGHNDYEFGKEINYANGNGGNGDMTKAELEDCIDNATQILTDAYIPEATREDLAAAIGDALDALAGEDVEGEDEDDDSTDDDGQ